MKIIKYKSKYFISCIELFIKVFNAAPWNNKWTTQKAKKRLKELIKTSEFKGYIGLRNKEFEGNLNPKILLFIYSLIANLLSFVVSLVVLNFNYINLYFV